MVTDTNGYWWVTFGYNLSASVCITNGADTNGYSRGILCTLAVPVGSQSHWFAVAITWGTRLVLEVTVGFSLPKLLGVPPRSVT